MQEINIAAHCKFYIRYHIVWIVKRRRMLLTPGPVVNKLVQVLLEIGKHYDIPVEEVGADGDHLHIFCQGHNDITPGRIVNILKSISAREMLRSFPELRQSYLGNRLWGVGYYIATVGYSSNALAVKAYIRSQGRDKELGNYVQLKLT